VPAGLDPDRREVWARLDPDPDPDLAPRTAGGERACMDFARTNVWCFKKESEGGYRNSEEILKKGSFARINMVQINKCSLSP
jgi:hypothetical protein